MTWIDFTDRYSVERGEQRWEPNTVLIRIRSTDEDFDYVARDFVSIHEFVFDDVEDDTGCTHEQGKEIYSILMEALKSNQNVLVHCHGGVSRSAAVAFRGQEFGFELISKNCWPNARVYDTIQA